MTDDVTLLPGDTVDLGQPGQIMDAPVVRVGSWLAYRMLYGGKPYWLDEYFPPGVVTRDEDGAAVPVSPEVEAAWLVAKTRLAVLIEGLERVVAAAEAAGHRPVALAPTLSHNRGPVPPMLAGPLHPQAVSLADHLAAGRRLSPEGVRTFARQLADALVLLHDNDVLHCDICPETVVLDGDTALLAHFTIDQRPFINALKNKAPFVRPPYSAIELYNANPHESISPSTDIYAASALLYELTCGNPAPDWHASVSARPDAPEQPEAFCSAIEKGLSSNAADTFITAEEWRDALGVVDADLGPAGWFLADANQTEAVRKAETETGIAESTLLLGSGTDDPPVRRRPRNWLPIVLALLALGAVAGLVAWHPWKGNVTPPPVIPKDSPTPFDTATNMSNEEGPIPEPSATAPVIINDTTPADNQPVVLPAPTPTPTPKVSDLKGKWRVGDLPGCAMIEPDRGGFAVWFGKSHFHHAITPTQDGWTTIMTGDARGHFTIKVEDARTFDMIAADGSKETWKRCPR